MIRGTQSTFAVLDFEGALARLGGDRKLYIDLIGFLLDDLPPLFSALRLAIIENDAASIRDKAHAIKGLVAGCGGVRASETAQAIENAGREGEVALAADHVKMLEHELQLLTAELRTFKQQ